MSCFKHINTLTSSDRAQFGLGHFLLRPIILSQRSGQCSFHLCPRNRRHNVSLLINLCYSRCIIYSYCESSILKPFIRDVNRTMLTISSQPHTMVLSVLLPPSHLALIPTAMSVYPSFFFIFPHLHPTCTSLAFSLHSL